MLHANITLHFNRSHFEFTKETLCGFARFLRATAMRNRPFHSYEWKRGWSCPCFHTNLPALLCIYHGQFPQQSKGGLYQNKVTVSLTFT